MAGYGFIVFPEERKLMYGDVTQLDEGECGTIFVDVECDWIPPAFRGQNKVIAHLYYGSNFAIFNATTEEKLKKRFPKSFAKNDAQVEYAKLRLKIK